MAPIDASNLLKPRNDLPWSLSPPPKPYWSRPFVIDNQPARAFAERLVTDERLDRALLRDQVEGELSALSAAKKRFWMAEYCFLEKFMSFDQLAVYAPGFISLSRVMPRKQVICRRMVIKRYLDTADLPSSRFVSRLRNRFTRSSILLYPAEKIFIAADKFVQFATRSADQSKRANRRRVIMLLRSLHMMTDQEICEQFRRPSDYHNELKLLSELARHYKIDISDVFTISAVEISQFWRPDIGSDDPLL
ncbi:MAG: hypothetical protein COB93_10430 [Sneathiella sp.]|nr:MAG: hypothetical protein COB93_10430 [Sneathiella sp.]